MNNEQPYRGKRALPYVEEAPTFEPVAAPEGRSNRKPLILVAVLALIAGLLGAGFYIKGASEPEAPPLTVERMPDLTGVNLTIPFTDEFGKALCKPVYDGAEIENGEADKKYEPGTCEPVTELKLDIPLNGKCPINEDGSIDAPSDYTTACSHADKRGGVAFLGHSVRGPRMGALERIHLLKEGDIVRVGDDTYQVAKVGRWPASNLPDRLWDKGHVSLITCFLDAKAEIGGEIVQDTVVELTDV